MPPEGQRGPVSTSNKGWRSWWSQAVGLAADDRAWALVFYLGIVALLHYVDLGRGHLLNLLWRGLPPALTRHSMERVLLVFPVIYAGFVFGTRGGLFVLLAAAIIMLPRALLISAHPVDATLETAMAIVVSALALWMIEGREKQSLELEQARAWETAYRTLFETVSEAIVLLDMEGKVLAANQAFARLTGYANQELVSMNLLNLFPGEDKIELWEARAEDEEPRGARLVTKNGRERTVELVASLINPPGGPRRLQCIAQDVTEGC